FQAYCWEFGVNTRDHVWATGVARDPDYGIRDRGAPSRSAAGRRRIESGPDRSRATPSGSGRIRAGICCPTSAASRASASWGPRKVVGRHVDPPDSTFVRGIAMRVRPLAGETDRNADVR